MIDLAELFGESSTIGGRCNETATKLQLLQEQINKQDADIEECLNIVTTEMAQVSQVLHNTVELLQSGCEQEISETTHELVGIANNFENALLEEIQKGGEKFAGVFEEMAAELQAIPHKIEHELQDAASRIERQIQHDIIEHIEHAISASVTRAVERTAMATLEMTVLTEVSEVLTTSLSPYSPEIIAFHKVAPAIQAAVDIAKGHF